MPKNVLDIMVNRKDFILALEVLSVCLKDNININSNHK